MGETSRHRALKRLALEWARGQGFAIAGVEISVPRLGCCRLDAAAARVAGAAPGAMPEAPITAIFECKQSRADFLRDARSEQALASRLARLHELKALYEGSMAGHFPMLRRGEALFPEFDGYRFEAAGFAPYDGIVREIRTLSARLHGQTKLGKLIRWQAANLCYLVAEPGVAQLHEVPPGWGLLVRREDGSEVLRSATWQEVPEAHRWELLLRMAAGNTREVWRNLAQWDTAGLRSATADA